MLCFLVDAAWTRFSVTGGVLQQYLVDTDSTMGNLAHGAARAVCTPAAFWAAHPDVPADALRLRILLSYHYFKDHDLDVLIPQKFTPPYPVFFADSGAFSAYTSGAKIRWQDYAAWLRRFRHWFVTMANLDVIGSPDGTAAHQHALEDAGLAVLPVFHTGEPWAVLDALCTQYQYLALGGMVAYAREWKTRLMPWLVRCFRVAQGRSVFHGFGCTTWEVMKALPWYSVDSSSWGAGFRFGTVPLFDWRRGAFTACDLGNPSSVGKAARLIRALGFDPADFAVRSRNTRAHNCGIAALSYCLAGAWLTRRWQRQEPPGAASRLFQAAGYGRSLIHKNEPTRTRGI
jgi:hypothetical protein